MSAAVVDRFDDAAPWSTHAPGGGATSLFAVSTVSTLLPDGYLQASRLQIAAQPGSAGRYAERATPAADLSKFQELRFWARGSRTGNGRSPFYLRLRLASAAVPFGDAGNTWSRYIPINVADAWQMVDLNITDLPAAIRGAVTALRFECADAATGFTITFDGLLAATPQMLPDVEAALQSSLDRQVDLGAGPIPAVIYQAGAAIPGGAAIRVSPAFVEYAPDLSTSEERRADFTDTGFVLRPPLRGYRLYYDIDADGLQPGDRAVLLDFVLGAIGAGRPLPVNGEYLPIEHIGTAWPSATPPVRLPLRFQVKAWKAMAVPAQPARPVRELVISTEGATL